jgi:hypothetical protein
MARLIEFVELWFETSRPPSAAVTVLIAQHFTDRYVLSDQGIITLTARCWHSTAEWASWRMRPSQHEQYLWSDSDMEIVSGTMTGILCRRRRLLHVEVLYFLIRELLDFSWRPLRWWEFLNVLDFNDDRYVVDSLGHIHLDAQYASPAAEWVPWEAQQSR